MTAGLVLYFHGRASCGRRRSSTIARASSSPPTPPGGSARRSRALADKARTIRIPVHIVEKLTIGRAERKLVTEIGHEPTPEEIAELTGIDPDEAESIKRSAQAPVSLEQPVGDDEQCEFGQFIADEQAESPYERAVEILTTEALRDARGRIRQIEHQSLKKLQNLHEAQKLRDDLEIASGYA